MMRQQGVASYQHTDIVTASSVQLIVLLYDGAIQAMKLAQEGIRRNHYLEKAHFIGRAMRIVNGLSECLDMDRGGDIARSLDDLYEYVLWDLSQANVRHDAARLDGPIRCLATLREAWALLAKREAVPHAVGQ
jgi:flagellar protein FliS